MAMEDPQHGIQVFVGSSASSGIIVAAYRGTEESSAQNWIDDLDVYRVDTSLPNAPSGVRVTSGFWNAYSGGTNAPTHAAVQKLASAYPNYQLIVTGHSLGAALATLLTVDLRGMGLAPTLYNYGSPRIGNTQFAAYASAGDVYRVTHYNDVVPHLPMENLGFWHVHTEYWEQEDGKVVQCNGSGEDPDCADSISLVDCTVSAHLDYLGVHVGCQNATADDATATAATAKRFLRRRV